MSDSKRVSARFRVLILVGCLAAVSFCTFVFWQRGGRELPITYEVPSHGAPVDVAQPPPPGPVTSVHIELKSEELEKAKEKLEAPTSTPAKWEKPKGFKIVGVIFYGRARFVNILDCYLKKNLVSRGGYLDEVRFMINTMHETDLEWLDELLKTEPLYKKIDKPTEDTAFDNIWATLQENNTMYLKLDDDVVFIDDDAIPRMVQTLQAHPEAHDVAANIVNSPLAHWLHYHTGAILPYLPEKEKPAQSPADNAGQPTSWRASQLPKAETPAWEEYEFPPRPGDGFPVGVEGGPAYHGQRWLPLENTPANLFKTPIKKAEYNPYGLGWTEWTIAAQQHYSLLDHLEKGDLSPYWAGGKDGLWNMQYERYNLNFLAIWGSSVAMTLPGGDDEEWLTVTIPRKLKRPLLVDTHAVIGHFSFGTTPELEALDLLDRYLAYANEKVCEPTNQRKTLEQKYMDSTSWHLQQPEGVTM